MKTKALIQKIFSQPTAPFREFWVLQAIEHILTEHKIPFYTDVYGQIIAGVGNQTELQAKPRLALMAHTDHPGFHVGENIKKNQYKAFWFGGAPYQDMKNAKLRIYNPSLPGKSCPSKILKMPKVDLRKDPIEILIEINNPDFTTEQCFGAFDFPAYKFVGDRIHTRVADDLAGVVIALGALLDQKSQDGSLIGIFTRAEEVGFVGCWQMLKDGNISQNLKMISLEASKALPLAEIGKGPVLRIGDRSTVFDSDLSILMWKAALELSSQKRLKFLYQRRLMDGGSCEATATNLWGVKTSGLSVPLLNYHNQGNKKPGAEIISLKDVENARRLCAFLPSYFAQNPPQNAALKERIDQQFLQLQSKLIEHHSKHYQTL